MAGPKSGSPPHGTATEAGTYDCFLPATMIVTRSGDTSSAWMPGSISKTDSAASWCSPSHGRTFWLTPLTKNPP